MTQSNILFIGMDVHKESIVLSLFTHNAEVNGQAGCLAWSECVLLYAHTI